jgi:hypothetical protein
MKILEPGGSALHRRCDLIDICPYVRSIPAARIQEYWSGFDFSCTSSTRDASVFQPTFSPQYSLHDIPPQHSPLETSILSTINEIISSVLGRCAPCRLCEDGVPPPPASSVQHRERHQAADGLPAEHRGHAGGAGYLHLQVCTGGLLSWYLSLLF